MANIILCNIAILVLASLFFAGNALVLEVLHHVPTKNQPYRTGYHFQPPKNWMNDLNGPMIYKGVYHLFYQWYPNGAVMNVNEIVWGHATSTDLINWILLSPAIKPSRPSDINGCWSGSVTILPNGKPVILYAGNDRNNHQVQNLAKPKNLTDPYLRHWTKSPENPLVTPNAVNHINSTAFRDPTTAWLGRNGWWHVVTGSQEGRRGLALLHTSRDFIRWKQSPKPLHYHDGTGMWECPDFFPVAKFNSCGLDTSSFSGQIKHVLKVSLSDHYYTIGTYDGVRDVYSPDKGFVKWYRGLDTTLGTRQINALTCFIKTYSLHKIYGIRFTQPILNRLTKNDKTTYGAFVDISPYQPISLRTLIDKSIVESFGGKGKACITSRIYPNLVLKTLCPVLPVFANQLNLKARTGLAEVCYELKLTLFIRFKKV